MFYSVSFTGKLFVNDRDKVAVLLSGVFPSWAKDSILRGIENRSLIKDKLTLDVANKIKSRIELSGAECVIALSELAPGLEADVSQISYEGGSGVKKIEVEIGRKRSAKIEGGGLCFVAVMLTILVFIFSEGYYPHAGLLISLPDMKVNFFSYDYSCGESGRKQTCTYTFRLGVRGLLVIAIFIFSLGFARFFEVVGPLKSMLYKPVGLIKNAMKRHD